MSNTDCHRSTLRVVEVLEQITQNSERGLTLTELSFGLNAPKSSLFPILHTLHAAGMLSLDENTARYTIGFKAYAFGNAYLTRDGLNADVLCEMRTIVQRCCETCLFAQLVEDEVLYLQKVDTTEPIRTVVSPGQRLPAYATGIGKALLSGKSKQEVQRLYPDGLHPVTEHTITDMDQLCAQLDEIKQSGLAFECEESTPHIQCIAVPIRQHGIVRAALSIAVPIFRFDAEKEALIIRLLRDAQRNIERLYGVAQEMI